ncbi:DNA-binding transcriptional LysR family regulator [Actinoplanes campanulatus]|uniref:DNA-binding transcriptional LysR family regulator n=1 Tax=Actinoplanes campanulatus TaxID=113559 RepID=A0A7W5ACD0_9ACTN|nr:LysR family transcriptional regulator [Actinoplanes campanulatus]MBB3093576.1 DNA-binding transcriptional LysR family regulator [Actinoplanes campanulatus]GGN04283.1 LysR family transcriptional regulator [Actinoplanes campanulatus]GID35349.1 LysR family transcriptional regulator [Actinoplanes campanulatus]
MIDVGRLRALHAVASYGTVLAAGHALHCTPSAVSQQLAKLERETGATLVEKDGRRLRLTEAGRVLADHAERVLTSLDEAETALAAHRDTVTGRLTMTAFATACRALMPHALRRLATDHPQLTTGLIEVNPHEGLDLLRRGHVDLAVLDDWPEVALRYPDGISKVTLGEDHADLVVPHDHRLAGTIALEEARHERWIGVRAGDVCYEYLIRRLPGVVPDFQVGEFETQLTLIAAGLGVGLIPRLARADIPDKLRIVRLDPVPTRRVVLAWRDSSAARPAIRAAEQALREAWKINRERQELLVR